MVRNNPWRVRPQIAASSRHPLSRYRREVGKETHMNKISRQVNGHYWRPLATRDKLAIVVPYTIFLLCMAALLGCGVIFAAAAWEHGFAEVTNALRPTTPILIIVYATTIIGALAYSCKPPYSLRWLFNYVKNSVVVYWLDDVGAGSRFDEFTCSEPMLREKVTDLLTHEHSRIRIIAAFDKDTPTQIEIVKRGAWQLVKGWNFRLVEARWADSEKQCTLISATDQTGRTLTMEIRRLAEFVYQSVNDIGVCPSLERAIENLVWTKTRLEREAAERETQLAEAAAANAELTKDVDWLVSACIITLNGLAQPRTFPRNGNPVIKVGMQLAAGIGENIGALPPDDKRVAAYAAATTTFLSWQERLKRREDKSASA